jgi:hemerythrin superfamily protein
MRWEAVFARCRPRENPKEDRMPAQNASRDSAAKTPTQGTTEGQSDADNKATKGQPKQTNTQDAVSVLKSDHRNVEILFEKYEATDQGAKAELAKQICTELIVHTQLEEELFYPACREKDVEDDLLNEAQVEHDSAKVLIKELITQTPDNEYYDAKVKVLGEYIKHHVSEEEKPSDGIFAKAQEAGVDMIALGQRIQQRKGELMAKMQSQALIPPSPVSLNQLKLEENQNMPRESNDRDRDDRGRFTNEDDQRRATSRGGYSSRGQDDDYRGRQSYRPNDRDDDERYGSRTSRSTERDRDDQGRFMSDDEDRGGSRGRSSSRDDDNRSSSRGGWFGDSRGHSQAAERGWEDRGGSRSSRGRDEDDDRGGNRGGRSNERDRDDQGRFMSDDERGGQRGGSSRSSTRGNDDNDNRRGPSGDRGHGGWFGDSRGHAEAAERGWQERSGSRSSRGRDDDNGRSNSRSREQDHGGWFGDSRGHSEAARRGRQNRD